MADANPLLHSISGRLAALGLPAWLAAERERCAVALVRDESSVQLPSWRAIRSA